MDEKWSFVYKKQKRCDDKNPADQKRGENWDHVAYDPEHRLVLSMVPGKRSAQNVRALVRETKKRMGGRLPRLITTDEYPAYKQAILEVYGQIVMPEPTGKRGRPRSPILVPPPDLLYATLHKTRRKGRVVKIEPRVVFGEETQVRQALEQSAVSKQINTSFIERHNGTDRNRNSRKVRKTYAFSKDWDIHEAVGYFSLYSYNFCWPVRTLRQRDDHGNWKSRTPAIAAGLTNHVWTLTEWLTLPAVRHSM